MPGLESHPKAAGEQSRQSLPHLGVARGRRLQERCSRRSEPEGRAGTSGEAGGQSTAGSAWSGRLGWGCTSSVGWWKECTESEGAEGTGVVVGAGRPRLHPLDSLQQRSWRSGREGSDGPSVWQSAPEVGMAEHLCQEDRDVGDLREREKKRERCGS